MQTFIKYTLAVFSCGAITFIGGRVFAEESPRTARGVVFVDTNHNRSLDQGERRLQGVKVSNGLQITQTDDQGRYELPVDNDTVIFVIKPRGYRTPLNENQLPQFYYIHKPNGSPRLRYRGVTPTGPLPKSIDFPLYPQKEPDHFKAVLFGDPQPRDQREVDYIAHDIIEELIDTDASFGVTLGDIVFDNLSLFESQARSIALIGIPWYNVIGNHDINTDAHDRRHINETFERHFGPSYYSFDYGTVHFLVLDDIDWYIPEGKRRARYRGGFGKRQLQFIKNDLSLIPKDQLVVLMMHVPLTGTHDRQELYRLIEQRPFCMSISAHTHHQEHRFIKKEDGWLGPKPHHHVINVTVCGSWWSGKPDERGIPHTTMADGAPNGYSIISFDGQKYRLNYKVAGRPASYQMRIHVPEVVSVDQLSETSVWVNVFNGSEKSTVEMRIGQEGDWTALKREFAVDPAYQQMYDADQQNNQRTRPALPRPKRSTHLWRANLPENIEPGTALLQVRTTDMHGQTFYGKRIVRITANSADH